MSPRDRTTGYRTQPESLPMNDSTQTPVPTPDLGSLADDAQALLGATANATGEKVCEARQRLAAALEMGKKALGQVKEKAIQGAKATDHAVREHPYAAIGIALGVGVLAGFLIGRRSSRRND